MSKMSSSTPNSLADSPISGSPPPSSPWEAWRDSMPITRKWVYFDHAAVAPLPAPTCRAMTNFATQAAESGDTVWLEWAGQLEQLRRGTANWLSVSDAEVALIPNTTFGINMVAEGLRWQEGDNIVIPGGEFPSNVFPWWNQQRRGVELRIVPSPAGRVDLDGIRRAIDNRTRIVAASWVGYSSGYRVPLEDLCQLAHQRGALFFLDAIQGLGIFPLDLSRLPIDFLAADGHKWLLGPEGAGIAFVRQSLLDQLDCPVVGWNSVVGSHHFSGETMELKPTAGRYEGGSYNMAGHIALLHSLQLFWQVKEQYGAEAISERILDLHGYARQQLRSSHYELISDWPRPMRSGILTFKSRGTSCQEIRSRLADAGIAVSCRGGGVRLSIHAYNTTDEIDQLIEALAAID